MFSCHSGASDIAFIRVAPLRTVSALFAAAIAIWPFAPSEHVHETSNTRWAPRACWSPAPAAPHSVDPDHRGDRHASTVDDDDSVILTLAPVFTAPSAHIPTVPNLAPGWHHSGANRGRAREFPGLHPPADSPSPARADASSRSPFFPPLTWFPTAVSIPLCP